MGLFSPLASAAAWLPAQPVSRVLFFSVCESAKSAFPKRRKPCLGHLLGLPTQRASFWKGRATRGLQLRLSSSLRAGDARCSPLQSCNVKEQETEGFKKEKM